MTALVVETQAQGWTSQAVATVVAASIAALAAIVGAVVAFVNAARIRQFTRQEQWWTRFSWALDKANSADPREYELGLAVLIALIDVPWATQSDNEMAVALANTIVPPEDGEQ
jgi:hypothetical protein